MLYLSVKDSVMNAEHHTAPVSPSGVGYKSPPSATQWKKGTSGNCKGRSKFIDLKALVQKANAKKATVTTASGKKVKVPQGELVLEKMAHEAINGDMRACKLIINFAKRYCESPVKPQTDSYLHVEELDNHLFFLKGFGCIPPDCATLNNLSKVEVQNAWNKFRKMWDDLDERRRMLNKMHESDEGGS